MINHKGAFNLMPTLKNPRHEQFAQLLASGKTPSQAYVNAGFSEAGASASAGRLLKIAIVRARVEELQEVVAHAAVTRASVDRDYVLTNLKENVERAMQHQPVLDSKGQPTGEYVYNGAVANRALELLGKELGLFVEKSEQTRKYASIDDLLADQDEDWLRREIARRKAEIERETQEKAEVEVQKPN